MSNLVVKFAVYGALKDGNENKTQAINVTDVLTNIFKSPENNGLVKISNETMGCDPSVGNKKHFGAIVEVNGIDQAYACEEHQTIDFQHVLVSTCKQS